jgi:hypothetical protein
MSLGEVIYFIYPGGVCVAIPAIRAASIPRLLLTTAVLTMGELQHFAEQ